MAPGIHRIFVINLINNSQTSLFLTEHSGYRLVVFSKLYHVVYYCYCYYLVLTEVYHTPPE